MAKIVDPSDFSDSELTEFLSSIERLDYSLAPRTPAWLAAQAEVFVRENPKPSVAEMREYIASAVRTAIGWNDPDNPRAMTHAALRAFYLIAWMDHLHRSRGHNGDVALARKVSFTPAFRHSESGL